MTGCRLAIADPPYLGRAEVFYGARQVENLNSNATARIGRAYKAPPHPDAATWDDPATHAALVARLVDHYDGWVIAMVPSNLRHYLAWVPQETRVAVWHDPNVMPNGCHPRRRWEPVLVYVPAGRRRVRQVAGPHVGDVLTAPHPGGFAGRKPAAWTRWCLSMLGYDQDVDTVEDLFPGSGSVANEVAQLTLTFNEEEVDL